MATLQEIRTRVRQKVDMENTEFVTDSEVNQLINTAYNELYGLLVRYSLQRTETPYTITANGSASYSLPIDFYSLIGIWRVDGQTKTRLVRFNERLRPGTVSGLANSYRLQGGTVVLYPTPPSGSYELLYIPVPGTLTADSDSLDGVLGWEELVVVEAAINCALKEEADVSVLRDRKAELMARIKEEAEAVEFVESQVVADRRGRYGLTGDDILMESNYLDRRGVRNWRWR